VSRPGLDVSTWACLLQRPGTRAPGTSTGSRVPPNSRRGWILSFGSWPCCLKSESSSVAATKLRALEARLRRRQRWWGRAVTRRYPAMVTDGAIPWPGSIACGGRSVRTQTATGGVAGLGEPARSPRREVPRTAGSRWSHATGGRHRPGWRRGV